MKLTNTAVYNHTIFLESQSDFTTRCANSSVEMRLRVRRALTVVLFIGAIFLIYTLKTAEVTEPSELKVEPIVNAEPRNRGNLLFRGTEATGDDHIAYSIDERNMSMIDEVRREKVKQVLRAISFSSMIRVLSLISL